MEIKSNCLSKESKKTGQLKIFKEIRLANQKSCAEKLFRNSV